MTISSETRKTSVFEGDSTVKTYTFAFKIFEKSNVVVTVVRTSTEVETVLVLDSDYEVTINPDQNANPGGEVNFKSTADIDGTGSGSATNGTLPTGYNMVISSQVPYLQNVDLTNQGGFYPRVITDAFDKLTIQTQQLKEEVDRSAKLPITNPEDADSLVADIVRIADSANNIDTVAGNIDAVNNVSTNMADVTQAVADAILVSSLYDEFDDRFLGTKSAAPTVDNDGDPIATGAVYFNDGTVPGDEGVWSWSSAGAWVKQSNWQSGIIFTADGQASPIVNTSPLGEIVVPFDCTITQVTLLADQSGTIDISIKKDDYATYGAFATTINAAGTVSLTAADKNQITTFTGWTTTLNKGDILRFESNTAVTSIIRLSINIQVNRT